MPTATVSSKGQITIPVEVRRKLRLHEGSQVDFIEDEAGDFHIESKTVELKDLYGIVKTDIHLTIEEMNEAIAQGAVESAGLGR